MSSFRRQEAEDLAEKKRRKGKSQFTGKNVPARFNRNQKTSILLFQKGVIQSAEN